MAGLPRCLVASLMVVAVVGCGGSSATPAAAAQATSLWSARSPYVGDNSRVAALVDDVGVARMGNYSISLRAAKQPYRLAIAFTTTEKPFANTDFSEQATLLLGLVGNLDEVSISAGKSSYVLTTAVASKELGYDVKRLGHDKGTLSRYLNRSSD